MRCSRQRARSRSLIARRRIERRSQLRVLLPPTAGVLRSRVIRDNPVERELQEKSVRIEQSFIVKRPPEVVFDYLTDPANLADWRTSKTAVEKLTEGPPRLGTRVRERTKAAGRKGVRADRRVHDVRTSAGSPRAYRRRAVSSRRDLQVRTHGGRHASALRNRGTATRRGSAARTHCETYARAPDARVPRESSPQRRGSLSRTTTARAGKPQLVSAASAPSRFAADCHRLRLPGSF